MLLLFLIWGSPVSEGGCLGRLEGGSEEEEDEEESDGSIASSSSPRLGVGLTTMADKRAGPKKTERDEQPFSLPSCEQQVGVLELHQPHLMFMPQWMQEGDEDQ